MNNLKKAEFTFNGAGMQCIFSLIYFAGVVCSIGYCCSHEDDDIKNAVFVPNIVVDQGNFQIGAKTCRMYQLCSEYQKNGKSFRQTCDNRFIRCDGDNNTTDVEHNYGKGGWHQ